MMDVTPETRINDSKTLSLPPLPKDDRFVLFAFIAPRRTPR
jgi:hypothetical protein